MPTDMAVKISLEAVSDDPRNAEKHFKLADIYKHRHEFDKAEEEYKAAVRLDSHNDAYHWGLGQFYEYERRNLVLAEAAYRDAVRLDPGSLDNNFCLGRIYEKQGKLALAEGVYSQLAELDPTYREAFARICEKQGKTNVATEEYGKAGGTPQTMLTTLTRYKNIIIIVTAALAAVAFILMFITYEQQRRRDQSRIAALENQSPADGGETEAERQLKVDIKDYKSQIEQLKQECTQARAGVETRTRLLAAAQYIRNNDPQKAIAELEAYAQGDAKNPVICAVLGDLYRSVYQLERARGYYEKAVAAGYDRASDALDDLKRQMRPKQTPPKQAPPKQTPPKQTPPKQTPPKQTPPGQTPKQRPPASPADLQKVQEVYRKALFEDRLGVKSFEEGASLAASRETILKFVASLKEYEKNEDFADTGAFLSGLIGNLPATEAFTLDVTHLETKLDYLGAYLRSRSLVIKGSSGLFLGRTMESGSITLTGDAGESMGHSMKGGEILVQGSAGPSVGYFMRNGTITIEGNADAKLGDCMEGGKIRVKGDAGELVGSKMFGGEIQLDGRYKSLARNIQGGKILHRGKQLYPPRRR